MSLVVLDPGLASRVVDMGRPRTRSLGVPLGGAADRASLALGNALLGNSPDAAALEICLKGPVVRAEVSLAVAVCGAPFMISKARQQLEVGSTFTLEAGEELHLGGAQSGMRAYLCVGGGFQIPPILGSCSALSNVTVGDVLPCSSGSIRRRFLPATLDRWPTARTGSARLYVVRGVQAGWFDEEEFFGEEFTVTPVLDRMGLRLKAKPLIMPERELVSEPVAPGAVQVTRDGQCIVLGVDGQTIGGYPKVAQVIQADWDVMAQLRPGERLSFVRVSLEEAAARYGRQQAWLREWVTRLHVSLAGL